MNAPKQNVTVSVRAADQPGQRGTHGTIVVRTKSSIGRSDFRTRGAMRRTGKGITRGIEFRNHSAMVKRIEGRADIRGGSEAPAWETRNGGGDSLVVAGARGVS